MYPVPLGAAGLYYVAVLGGVLLAARWGGWVAVGRRGWVAVTGARLGGAGAAGGAAVLCWAAGRGVERLGLGWVYGSRRA